jgi:hypothetical protein
MTLLSRADADTAIVPREFAPSLSGLARETGLARSTVAVHLAVLERAGWITRHRSRRAAQDRIPTWYEVHLPASPGAGLDREPDQGAGPGAGPGLAREPDGASPGAGPNQNSSRPKPEHPTGAVSPDGPTAQAILGAFIDFDRAHGGQLSRRTIGQLARHIDGLLAEGFADRAIRQGLAAWRARGQHPSTLHSFVDAVMAAPAPASRRQSERDAMFDRALARAQARDATRDAGSELP